MKKFILSLAMISSLSLTTACRSSSAEYGTPGNPDNGPSNIPDTVDFKPRPARAINSVQLAEMKALLQKSRAKLPTSAAIFPLSAQPTQDEKDQKQKAIDVLDTVGKQWLSSIQTNCTLAQLAPPTTNPVTGTPRVGDKTSTVTGRSVAGAPCPVMIDENAVVESTVTESKGSTLQDFVYGTKLEGTIKSIYEVKDSIYQTISGSLKTNIQGKMSGLIWMSAALSKMYIDFSGQGEFHYIDSNNVAQTAALSMLSKSLSRGKGILGFNEHAESVSEIIVHMPKADFVFQTYTVKENEAVVTEAYFINGIKVTKQDMEDIFGPQSDKNKRNKLSILGIKNIVGF